MKGRSVNTNSLTFVEYVGTYIKEWLARSRLKVITIFYTKQKLELIEFAPNKLVKLFADYIRNRNSRYLLNLSG